MTDVQQRLIDVRNRVDSYLGDYFARKREETASISGASMEMVDAIFDLTMRGGKRLRPIVLDAAYRSVAPNGSDDATIAAGAALEVLQSYLLIHDDWMDQDDERRGGPAVHKIFEKSYPEHLAASLAILAGDLASAYAWELFFEAPFPAARFKEACERFLMIQKEVYFGQHLDTTAHPDVSRMHDLKTGSYTVRGPLMLGAILGNASDEQMTRLLAWGNPLGEAFQLADDLLGTFGTAETTGKPGDDLRHRKRNSLVAEAERTLAAEERRALDHLMTTTHELSDEEVSAASELLVTSGIRSRIENKVDELYAEAVAVLEGAPLDASGIAVLTHVAERLTKRTY